MHSLHPLDRFKNIGLYTEKLMEQLLDSPVPFMGLYSDWEVSHLLFNPFGRYSPIRINQLAIEDYQKIPLLSQTRYLLNLIIENKAIKLTQTGNLPVKIVKDIVLKKFIYQSDKEAEFVAKFLVSENDIFPITISKMILLDGKFAKKRNKKISATELGREMIKEEHIHDLLQIILDNLARHINWAYLDNFEDEDVGQVGAGLSLLLVSIYGNEKREASFYANKYLKIIPDFLMNRENDDNYHSELISYYTNRTFRFFMKLLGLIEQEDMFDHNRRLTMLLQKSSLFDKFIRCISHSITITN